MSNCKVLDSKFAVDAIFALRLRAASKGEHTVAEAKVKDTIVVPRICIKVLDTKEHITYLAGMVCRSAKFVCFFLSGRNLLFVSY